MIQVKSTDKICNNCKHLEHLVGIGQGLRCGHQTKRVEGKIHPLVPSRYHTCELFEFKIESKINQER